MTTSPRLPHDATVEIVRYDGTWPAKFETERPCLEAILAPWLAGAIEHIGSTAVPSLPAKPVIDIMAPVRTLEGSRPAIVAATRAGYVYHPYRADVMHWFCKPSPQLRSKRRLKALYTNDAFDQMSMT